MQGRDSCGVLDSDGYSKWEREEKQVNYENRQLTVLYVERVTG